jgi:hypothetical protein
VWIAGIFYPSLGVGAGVGWGLPSVHPEVGPLRSDPQAAGGALSFLLHAYAPVFLLPFVAVVFLPLFRLVAGLARTGSSASWTEACAGQRTPSLRSLWRAGSGLTLPTYGLWLQLVLMQMAAVVVLLFPVLLAVSPLDTVQANDRPLALLGLGVLVGPVIFVLGAYMLALSVLGQLGLQSLAENRRGVSSALQHAWRLMRHDPWATARAVVADLVLLVSAVVAVRGFAGLVQGLPGDTALVVLLQVGVSGFAGVVRAGYWARAYRALGGLSPRDGVPGLARAA